MKAYEATATIAAAPEAVWKILLDGQSYTQWDSGVVALEGTIAPGERLKVTSEANPGRAFPVRVTEVAARARCAGAAACRWGCSRRAHVHADAPGDDGTDFKLREEYSGPMLGLIWKSMPDLGPSFDKFARGLKQRAEQND